MASCCDDDNDTEVAGGCMRIAEVWRRTTVAWTQPSRVAPMASREVSAAQGQEQPTYMEARGWRVRHGGNEAGAEAEVSQLCDLAAHCHGQSGTLEMWWWPSHGFKVQVSAPVEGGQGCSNGDSGLTSMWSLLGDGIGTVCHECPRSW
jgi:hypothetical protein